MPRTIRLVLPNFDDHIIILRPPILTPDKTILDINTELLDVSKDN